jgi:hypothetical protein
MAVFDRSHFRTDLDPKAAGLLIETTIAERKHRLVGPPVRPWPKLPPLRPESPPTADCVRQPGCDELGAPTEVERSLKSRLFVE